MNYVGQTSKEMVDLFLTIYKGCDGEEWAFVRDVTNSIDNRIKDMSCFECEVVYHFCKAIEEGY